MILQYLKERTYQNPSCLKKTPNGQNSLYLFSPLIASAEYVCRVCMGLHGCLCGMKFKNMYLLKIRVLTSADFNTYPTRILIINATLDDVGTNYLVDFLLTY